MLGQDFIINRGGVLTGNSPVANLLASTRCDVGLLRPFFADDGHASVTVNTNRTRLVNVRDKRTGRLLRTRREPIYEEVRVKDLQDLGIQLPSIATNATSLRKDEWLRYDGAVIEPARDTLRLLNDIERVDTFSFPGLGIKMLEHETVSDPGRAYMDMDGLSEGTDDTPLWKLEGQPIPIFHSNFTLDLRTLESSRRSGMPLSTRGVEWATRRILELAEANAIGVAGTPMEWGASPQTSGYGRTPGVYGLLNFPDRITKTDLTAPTGSNPEAVIADILEMRSQMYSAKHFGPYGIYHSIDYDPYMDMDYSLLGGNNANSTLRRRILEIGAESADGRSASNSQIQFVRRLDTLTPANSHAFTMVMVSLNPRTIRLLNGMPITVFQYETRGGWQLHFRVAMIKLVEMFSDYYGNCGILHARTA